MRHGLLALAFCVLLPAATAAQADFATLVDRGHLRQAESLLEAHLAAQPDDARALCRLTRVRAAQGRLDEAITLGERAVALAPRSAETHYALAEVFGAKARRAGAVKGFSLAGRLRKELDAALAADAGHVESLRLLIAFHRRAPGIAGGDRKKMPELLDRLSQVDPVAGWLERAAEASGRKDSVSAESCLRRACEAEMSGARARTALASWLAAPWRGPAEAERLALDVVSREPWRQEAWGLAAALQARAGRREEAEATLRRAEAADAGRLGACYVAGRELMQTDEGLARAEQCFRRYLTREPEFGWPSHGAAHWRLGLILEKRGDRAGARAEIQTALRLQPDLEPAKKDLKRLKG